MKKTVAIIGGAGFIGSHTVKKFLSEGYEVRASVRDKTNKKFYEHLFNLGKIDIHELDVTDYSKVLVFVKGAENVIHAGTPFYFGAKDAQNEMFNPTVAGTENVIEACEQTDAVKKLVLISSTVAINSYVPVSAYDPNKGEDHVFTEKDEPNCLDTHDPYCRAKYEADQKFRKYVNEHSNSKFEIISLYPGFVVGAPLSGRQDSSSFQLLYGFKNKMTEVPAVKMFFDNNTEFAMVAVEDVAEAAYLATKIPNLHGEKYLISNEAWRTHDIHRMLNGESPQGSMRIQYSNEKVKRELGMKFKPASEPLNALGKRIDQAATT